MARSIPMARDGSLHQHTAGGTSLDPIMIGTAAWYSWLEQHRSFCFEAGRMTFTARKEQRPGGHYWYAYRRRHGKLHTAYIGKSEELTLERLNTTAEALERAGDAREGGTHRPLRVFGDHALQVLQASIISLPTTRAVTEQLREPKPAPKRNLPVQLTPLIGRKHDSASAAALLRRPEIRLLTLTGTAGVGKTRLALHLATELLDGFADGVYFVPLAPISDHALVVPTIAQTLTLREVSDRPFLDLLEDYLQDKQLLLVLDNFEQVVRAAPLLSELLEVCLELKLLVTSREVLHLRAEHQFAVPPLALPDLKHLPDSQSLSQYAAVELFLQRAQAVKPDFQITPANARAIGEICSRLDGLPLALELAAARIKLLSPQALLARLEHRLSVLTGGAQDVPVRQQTLRNTIEWSYNLLNAQEQQLFRRLCVFVGGGTLEAIEAICARLNDGVNQMLDGVASLIDKSLLQQKEQEDGQPRFLMLETIREYGLEALEASGEVEATRQAHGAYYLRLAEEAEQGIRSPLQTAWLEHLEREHDNLRAALQWMLEHGEIEQNREMTLRLAAALSEFWRIRGYDSEGQTFLEQALAAREGVATSVRAKILRAAGRMAIYQNDYERAEVLCEESLVLFRELGDTQGIAHSLHYLGWAARERGNLTNATPLVEEALALRRKLGHKEDIAWSLLQWGILNCTQGEYARAGDLFEESLALSREMARPHVIAWSLYRLAEARFLSQGELATVHSLLAESLPLFKTVGEKSGMICCFYLSGRLALSTGDAPLARSLAEQGLALSREVGDRWSTGQLLSLLGGVAAHQGDHATARALYQESLALARRAGRKLAMASCLQGLAGVVAAQGESTWATRLWGVAEAMREATGAPIPPVERAEYERALASARAQLGEKTFAAAWEEGHTMSVEQALASQGPVTTSQQSTPLSPRPAYPDGLTAREVEVLRLVALGMTDAQIAGQLVLSPRTVQGHLRSIYNKLNVTSRSAATRYTVEHKLV
jgi:predicted ATPase/DNA-binding CsgD family transcriptional regulator